MTSKHQRNFGIHPKNHKKVFDILDKWEKRGDNFSHKVCLAIEKLDAEEERGTKIDQFIEPVELIKLPRINQELKEEDMDLIANTLSRRELGQLRRVMALNLNRMNKEVFYNPKYRIVEQLHNKK